MKTVLITGATRGVGKEIAKMFVNNNYNVVITGRNKNESTKVADELNSIKLKKNVKGYKLDFTDLDGSSELLNKLESKKIKPNFLINNAGTLNLNNIDKITFKNLDVMFKVNLYGPLLLSKYCLDIVKHNNTDKLSGILFNVPPYNIDDKTTYLLPYMQSKLAQNTLMKSLANLNNNNNALICGFWTNFPLLTDAIIKKNVGTKNNCMHPSILAKCLEELIFNTNNPMQYNSKVIIDELFLKEKKININKYKMGNNVKNLDDLFITKLTKDIRKKKDLFNK